MMARPEFEALYGGAAGGGKSDFLLAEALRQVDIPHYRGIIIRRTYPELSDLIDRSKEIYPQAFPSARYNESKHVWSFKSGAKIYMGYMQYEKDRLKYQGRHFDFIGFDELTHFTESQYLYLFSRARPSGPGTEVYIRSTANPGGVGHAWVKARFISVADPGTPIVEETVVTGPDGKKITVSHDRVFIPSSIWDNQILLDNDPGYIASLAMLPTAERKALLEGDWDSFSGQVFDEWRNDPEGYETRQWSHVIKPFKVPSGWMILRAYDFGYAKPFSVGWYAIDYSGRMYRIRELYGCEDGMSNVGIKIDPREQARRIREIEAADENLIGKRITGIADPSIFASDRGESIADMMAREGVYWTAADNERIAGKMQVHYRLAFGENGIPMLYVFDTCKHFIRTIPSLVYDEKKVEDVDTTQEDHIYDELRYACMEYRIPMRQNVKRKPPMDDPLDLYKEERKKAYKFIRI